MSGHDEASFFIAGKDMMALHISRIEEEDGRERADSREEERQFCSPCDSFSISTGRDEEPVQLYPRFDPSFDTSEHDQYSIQAACTSPSLGSTSRDFFRDSILPPPLPEIGVISSNKRDKPSLCRSMAWSQDSLDERRIPKRCRREDASPTALNEAFSFSGYQQSLEDSTNNGPIAIHWEEKIVDSMELISFLDRAATVSNVAGLQSA